MSLADPLSPRTARRLAACVLSILALAAPARPQGGGPNFEGLYLGSGQLVQPCQFPSGPATFMDTILSARFTVTQYIGVSRIAGPFHARRPDGSEYDNSLDLLVTISANGTLSGVADYMYDENTQVHLVSSGRFQGNELSLTTESHIVYLPDGGFCDQTITLGLVFIRPPTRAHLEWKEPNGGELSPPRELTARIVAAKALDAESPRAVTGYKIYSSTTPNVEVTPDNLYTTTPPNQTTVDAAVPPSGAFFVVTACYGDQESPPSNEAGAGQPGAAISKVTIKSTKIVAKGTGFTTAVAVFLDGIPFVSRASVKGGAKVVQKGNLLTGESIAAYFTPGRTVEVAFANDDGTITRMMVTK